MIYGSVCSGIEAASVAWKPLGWKAAFFSEIEKFPSAVLDHHYPNVPNLGDMTKFKEWPDAIIDVLVGGTPCQSFSIAGLRKGLADPRGNLMLTYLAIADRYRPEWLVWENVPGVLSSNGGKDFGTFLGGLGELGYGFSYRVLDAQFFGVPQRRRRVFVVGHLGNWRRAAAVLFERHSLQGHLAPSREARQTAPTIPSRSTAGGGLGTDFDCDGGLINCTPGGIAGTVSSKWSKGTGGPAGDEHYNLITHSLRGEGFDASEDGTGRGTPLVPVVAGTLKSNSGGGGFGSDPSETFVPIAFDCKASGQYGFGVGQIASTLRSMGHANSHQNGNGHQAVCFQTRGSNLSVGEVSGTFGTNASQASGSAPMAQYGMQVRRLTPRECERLQGFPDDYSLITVRGKPAADGPRYKALGNSFAVPVVRWIGERIQQVQGIEDGRN